MPVKREKEKPNSNIYDDMQSQITADVIGITILQPIIWRGSFRSPSKQSLGDPSPRQPIQSDLPYPSHPDGLDGGLLSALSVRLWCQRRKTAVMSAEG